MSVLLVWALEPHFIDGVSSTAPVTSPKLVLLVPVVSGSVWAQYLVIGKSV